MLEEPLCEVGVGVGQPQQLVGQHRAVLLAVGHPAQARVARVLHNSDLESGLCERGSSRNTCPTYI